MTTFFLDFAGGNDASDGTTFANRWKTFASGATAARIAPGDLIKVMQSTPESSLGMTATWTKDSKTVTLNAALTQTIDDCEVAWTQSANVTSTADAANFKENTKAAKHVIAAAFTTGLAAFKATGALNLSGYQQVSFWIFNSVAVPASNLSLRLCSDVAGAVSVNTIAIPAITSINTWTVITVDTGGALGASIQSVALYVDTDFGAVNISLDDIIACKASASADALTLTSLIGKVWNLCWVASTVYAANDIRKPTQPNRNGLRYKVTAGGGGAAGGAEPTWPTEIGVTVVDGALTWTCEGLEDTWFPIQSINGTTVKIDNVTSTIGNVGKGYSGDTETVASYKREPTILTMVTGVGTALQQVQEAGTLALPTVYSGGWDSTNMTTQSGETWVGTQNGLGIAFNCPTIAWNQFKNLNVARASTGFSITSSQGTKLTNIQTAGAGQGILVSSSYGSSIVGAHCCNGNTTGGMIDTSAASNVIMRRISGNGNVGNGSTGYGINMGDDCVLDVVNSYHNANAGIQYQDSSRVHNGILTRSSGIGMITVGQGGALIRLRNSNIQEASKYGSNAAAARVTSGGRDRIYSQDDGQVAGTHLITFLESATFANCSTIGTATDQRHTASGVAWKALAKSVAASSENPLPLSVAKVAVGANTLVTAAIWVRRDSTQIQGILVVEGGQIAGIPEDVSVSCTPSINTWIQYTLTFTPTAAGVVELKFKFWDGTGTTNSLWIDDFTVSQA